MSWSSTITTFICILHTHDTTCHVFHIFTQPSYASACSRKSPNTTFLCSLHTHRTTCHLFHIFTQPSYAPVCSRHSSNTIFLCSLYAHGITCHLFNLLFCHHRIPIANILEILFHFLMTPSHTTQ